MWKIKQKQVHFDLSKNQIKLLPSNKTLKKILKKNGPSEVLISPPEPGKFIITKKVLKVENNPNMNSELEFVCGHITHNLRKEELEARRLEDNELSESCFTMKSIGNPKANVGPLKVL
jgi:hypothetical protein